MQAECNELFLVTVVFVNPVGKNESSMVACEAGVVKVPQVGWAGIAVLAFARRWWGCLGFAGGG